MLSIATWNVNSLRVRLPQVLRYIDEVGPDVLCLQETRVGDAAFPRSSFTERGYDVAAACTGGYAGVAIASKRSIDEAVVGLPGFSEQKSPGRRLACLIGARWVDTVYVPTRTGIGKVEFLEALKRNYGMRLDYAFASSALSARIAFASHDLTPRTWPRPSDHLPLLVRFVR